MTWRMVSLSAVLAFGLVILAYWLEYGNSVFSISFRPDISVSGWGLSFRNSIALAMGLAILFVFVLYPIGFTYLGKSMKEQKDEWSQLTGLAPDLYPLAHFEIKKRKRKN